MNKNRYRIIFSHARGMFIAVAEIVKSKTKQAGQSQGAAGTDSTTVSVLPIHYKKLNPLNFAVIGCLGALVISLPMSSVAETQIIADKGAPTSQQPTILTSANGTTQVNIQTPSAGGVSRNTYTQFDVGQEGAILNNSRNNTQTQLGGWVQGNPWLAKGEAKVILNEVNSNNPSQLKGYIEVAGKQAQVVIANPSGLICDGCGVINADRFTLTTGQAVMNQGYLESFRVREGQVTIEGKGLNGSLTPYTDIYARALKVNAGLYANELNTVLGQNDIQVKDQVAPQITATTGPTTTPPPSFALDVGQLGGMYAGKIFLVGTEQGLGVRNAGTINSTQGTLTLNANGDLVNNGNLIANKDQVQLKAQNIQNTDNVSSATSQITIESQNLDNSGLISSADELHLNQQNSLSNTGTLNAARVAIDASSLKNSGSIEQTGLQGLDLKSGSMTNLGGKIGVAKSNTSGGTAGNSSGNTGSTVIVPTVPVDPAQDGGSLGVVPPIDTTPKTYDIGFIHVSGVLGNDQGTIIANGGVDLESQNGLDNQGGQLNLGTATIKGSNFNNDLGQLNVKQADIQTLGFTNQQGQLTSSDTLKIQSQNANNQSGKIQSIGQLDLAIGGELNNSKGYVASGDNVLVSAGDLNNQFGVVYSENQSVNIKANQAIDNTEGFIQAKTDLNLNSQTLNNTSGQIIGNQIQQQHGTVNNSQGAIIAKQNLNSTAQQFDNDQGQLQATTVQLQHDQLKNNGGIYADKDLTVTGKDIQNSGSLAAGENIKITSSALEHAQNGLIAAGLDHEGKLADTGMLTINVDRAGLHGQTFAGQHIQINATGTIDAAQGQLQSKTIALNAGTDISTQAATVVAQDQLKLTSQNLINNQQGQLNSQDIILSAQQLDNSQGKIQHTGNNEFTLNFVNGLNNKSGEISSNAALMRLNTSILNNEAGQIIHSGNQQLNINSNQLQGAQGKILSNGQLVLATEQAILDGAITSADQINITAYNLSHQKGQMIQRGTLKPLTLAIRDQINNQLGFIQSPTALYITAGSLNNQGGQLSSAADHDLQLDVAGLLDNSQSGQIYAGLNNNIHAGSINNSMAGQIAAQNALTLTSLGLINNQSGKIVANADVGIRSEGLDNTSGQIGSVQAGLALNAGTGVLSNQSGSLQSGKDIKVQAGQLKTQSGLINAQGSIEVTAGQDIDNSSGQIIANKAVQLSSQGLTNNAGQIGSVEGTVHIDAGTGVLSNQQGKLQSSQDLTLK
ncbi:filamentous hemagglutinin N-terminal domain-containing protein, partial [Acinetobacter sp. V110_1]|uniref:two-partner secretion domain-containing protein n=1 Tax=Acinetobacter sp. V110_1 TaxID=3072988 RepID=UPI00287C46B5